MAVRRPTLYDVAELARVSTATVSNTYRRPDKVVPETRRRVLAAARELGYLPSGAARSMAQGRNEAFGLFSFDYLTERAEGFDEVPEPVDPTEATARTYPLYGDEIQRGIELECRARGYALLLQGGSGADSEAMVADIASKVDGLAVFPGTVPYEVLLQIARRIPVVELGATAFGDRVGHVTVDNVEAMQTLVQHLLSVHGLRELVFVEDHPGADNTARFEGFKAALRAAGLPTPAGPAPVGSVLEAVCRGEVPQGLVCSNDLTALRVLHALNGRGLRVPRDVAVTGFDALMAGRLSTPALTTVHQPMVQMGREVVDMLINRLNAPGDAPEQRQLKAAFVQRESCGCAF